MDTHTRSAQDLLLSEAQSHDTDELEHEAATDQSAHAPSNLQHETAHEQVRDSGHAEKDVETASLSFGDALEPETAQPLTMPGEHETEVGEPSSPLAPVAATRPSTRNLLLGTALAFTLMVAGGSIYILSHRGHAVQTATTPPPMHAEQATRNPVDLVGGLAANPFPSPARHTEQAASGTDDILLLRHKNIAVPAATTLAAPKATPPAVAVPAAPASATLPPIVVTSAAVRPDPVATALALRPASMTPQQQVDVLSLVTQLASLVRDMRTENNQLRDKVASLDDMVKSETSDVSQRLNLIEARKAIASAQDAGNPPPPGSGTAAPPAVVRPVAVVPVPVAIRSVRDYRVQAASPGLAILADADAAPGQSAGLQVAVGDMVPGVGRITSIAQRGTAWVVKTSHGAIQ